LDTPTCGIDWAEGHHDVAIVDQAGKLIAKKRIQETPEGFAELLGLLSHAGEDADAPIPVAIETPRGLLVAALRATGRRVFSINPMAVARYRERSLVSRGKSDHADAMTLANILRTDAHVHRALPADTELVQAIAVLARATQDATWRRTKASNELRSLLREYFPTFLHAFAAKTATNLASREARARSSRSPPRRRPRRSCPRCVSLLLYAAPAVPATSRRPRPNCMLRYASLSCVSPIWWNRPWAARPWPC
jgi:transposase